MQRGGDQGRIYRAHAAEIAHERIAGKAHRIDERDRVQIIHAEGDRLRFRCVQENAHAGQRGKVQHGGNGGAEQHGHDHAVAESPAHAIDALCTKILRYEYGNRRAIAGTERIGKALDAHRSGIGGDAGRAQQVHRALHENLAEVQAGLMQRGGKAEYQRIVHHAALIFEIRSRTHQIAIALQNVDKAQRRGNRL